MNIVKEEFKAWVNKQPDNRVFNYYSHDCVLGRYFKEEKQLDNVRVAGSYYYFNKDINSAIDIPNWLRKILLDSLDDNDTITVSKLKTNL